MNYISLSSKPSPSAPSDFILQPRIQASNFKYSSHFANGEYIATGEIYKDQPVFKNKKETHSLILNNYIRDYKFNHYHGFEKNSQGEYYYINTYHEYIEPLKNNSLFSNAANFLNFKFQKNKDSNNPIHLGFLFYKDFEEKSFHYLNENISSSDFKLSFEYMFPSENYISPVNFGILIEQNNDFYKIPLSYLGFSPSIAKVNIENNFLNLNNYSIFSSKEDLPLDLSGDKSFQIGFYADCDSAFDVYLSNFEFEIKNFYKNSSYLFFDSIEGSEDLTSIISTNNQNINKHYIYGPKDNFNEDNFVFNSLYDESFSFSSDFSSQNGYIHALGKFIEIPGNRILDPDGDGLVGEQDLDPYNLLLNQSISVIFSERFFDLGVSRGVIGQKLKINIEGYSVEFDNTLDNYLDGELVTSLYQALQYLINKFNSNHHQTGIHLSGFGPNIAAFRPKGGSIVLFSCDVTFNNYSVTLDSELVNQN